MYLSTWLRIPFPQFLVKGVWYFLEFLDFCGGEGSRFLFHLPKSCFFWFVDKGENHDFIFCYVAVGCEVQLGL